MEGLFLSPVTSWRWLLLEQNYISPINFPDVLIVLIVLIVQLTFEKHRKRQADPQGMQAMAKIDT